jgi:uncharacterized membrane protein
MSVAATMCGFYCALTSAVGIYFYLVLAIMEYKGNLTLKYIWNVERPSANITNNDGHYIIKFDDDAPSQATKGAAFLVLAVIEAAFLVGCCICANISKNADKAEEVESMRMAKNREYQAVGSNDEQIMS